MHTSTFVTMCPRSSRPTHLLRRVAGADLALLLPRRRPRTKAPRCEARGCRSQAGSSVGNSPPLGLPVQGAAPACSEFRVYSSLTRQTDQDRPIRRSWRATQLEAHCRGKQTEDHARLDLHDVAPAQEHGAPRLLRAADRVLGVTPNSSSLPPGRMSSGSTHSGATYHTGRTWANCSSSGYFGNTAPRGQLLVHGRRERLGPPAIDLQRAH
eukprot:scaffold14479_cov68-Phaeocystis_antarctica.AAC.4